MSSHKVLKVVANNLVGSFLSQLNFYDYDYLIGHIIEAAWRTGATELKANILTGEINPSKLLTKPVEQSINSYVNYFPDLVNHINSSMDFIKSAELIVTVDPRIRRPHMKTQDFESPFTCTANIIDDRGKLYTHTVNAWFAPAHQ